MEKHSFGKTGHLSSGWAFDNLHGCSVHFEHFPYDAACDLDDEIFTGDNVYIVETINWSIAEDDQVHKNQYYVEGAIDALALAMRIVNHSDDIVEDVVGIRVCTLEEYRIYEKAHNCFLENLIDLALSDAEMETLPDE